MGNGRDVVLLKDVEVPEKFYKRIRTHNKTIDEIFGGKDTPGLVRGTVQLVTGKPGTGKTTLVLQMADMLTESGGRRVLYNVGEQSDKMVKMAADRLGIAGEFGISRIGSTSDLIERAKDAGAEILVQDSLQSLGEDVKGTTKRLLEFAQEHDVVVLLIGQITKSGQFAGPQMVEHDTDAHLTIRFDKDTGNRVLEMQKNRFGPSHEPYEILLSANGLNFSALPEPTTDLESSSTRAVDRKNEIVRFIKEKLLEGELISGYCFNRLSVDVSGNFWRQLVEKACEQLRREGHKIGERKVNLRTHYFVTE